MNEHKLHFNGIDGATGGYAIPPCPLEDVADLVASRRVAPPLRPRPLKFGLDPLDLADAGWGIIWPEDARPQDREALQPLLDLRRAQASRKQESRFKEFRYLPGETILEFWSRHGLGPDAVDPEKMPYYLLIVGEPSEIPFGFQMELGVPHAVGRVSFDDPQGYDDYGRQLMDSETRALPEAPVFACFGVENPEDPPTKLSVEHLARPLEQGIARECPDWRVRTLLRQAADKAALSQLLGSPGRPKLLFSASHAVRFHADSSRQRTHQGAILCSDWPGQRAWQNRGPIPDDFFFCADDLEDGTELEGLVAFLFACFSAGTPQLDSYAERTPRLASRQPFVSHLAKKLLQSGAAAVIGHVDLTFHQSFLWSKQSSQSETFLSAVQAILTGVPVGHAMSTFGERLGMLGTILAEASRSLARTGHESEDIERFGLWSAYQDARNYVILGDPAARLNVGS